VKSTYSPKIRIHSGESVTTISLSEQTIWTFGRSKENTVQLKDLMASRIHAQLEIHDDDRYYFVDLGSSNGTLINDELLSQTQCLNHGDRISIGNTLLVFEKEFGQDLGESSISPKQQVLMLHASAAQAAFWQAILDFKRIPALKEDTLQRFKDQVDSIDASDTAPKVLLIDTQAYQGDCYQFCRWLQQKHPNYQIFLTDSKRSKVSSLERQVAIKNGALNQFSAMSRRDLVLNTAEVLEQVNEVLQALECKFLEKEEMLYLLRMNNGLKAWYSNEKSETT
jgi:pSer/pThr/pTyr-binding forkhead associated (FHA) protein